MAPSAYIIHSIKGRIRIQIPEKRKDNSFFSSMKQQFERMNAIENITVNDLTGTILLTGKNIDINTIQMYAQKNALFQIKKKSVAPLLLPSLPKPLTTILTNPIGSINQFTLKTSNNSVDLAGLFFLSLMGIGVFQIFRGNLILPSWHTAFWYSLGIYSTQLKS